MVDQPAAKTGFMTLEELVKLYETKGPFELIDGECIPVNPMVMGHNFIARKLYDSLHSHSLKHEIGEVFFEASFVLIYDSNWVKGSREPDVLFVSAQRWSGYIVENPDWQDKPLVLVPDLVIKVISPNDQYSDVEQKIDRYQEDGVQIVWVVDPRQKAITLRRQDFYKKLHLSDLLTADEVIPGFEMSVKAVFE